VELFNYVIRVNILRLDLFSSDWVAIYSRWPGTLRGRDWLSFSMVSGCSNYSCKKLPIGIVAKMLGLDGKIYCVAYFHISILLNVLKHHCLF